jgi:hypothetical protein
VLSGILPWPNSLLFQFSAFFIFSCSLVCKFFGLLPEVVEISPVRSYFLSSCSNNSLCLVMSSGNICNTFSKNMTPLNISLHNQPHVYWNE